MGRAGGRGDRDVRMLGIGSPRRGGTAAAMPPKNGPTTRRAHQPTHSRHGSDAARWGAVLVGRGVMGVLHCLVAKAADWVLPEY